MAQQQTQPEGVVYVEPEDETNRTPFYARIVTTPGGQRLRKIFLDIRNTPHETDELVPQWLAIRSTQMNVVWWKKLLNEDDPDRDPEERDDFANGKLTTNHVYAPTTLAFPHPQGWNPEDRLNSPPPPSEYTINNLAHATIHRLTYLFTQPHINGARPNCEANWALRYPRGPPIPWRLIWPSLGTPLSDATEEREWRKLLHRGIYVRNRRASWAKFC